MNQGEDNAYISHIRSTAESASRDFDDLIAKLGTAGLTLAAAATKFLEGSTVLLGWAASMFAASTLASLTAGRISADALRRMADAISEGANEAAAYDKQAPWFSAVKILNWIALIAIATGLVLGALFVARSKVRSQ